MVKPAFVFWSVVTLVVFLAILVAFVVIPDSGPFDRGDTPSKVIPGEPGVKEPVDQ